MVNLTELSEQLYSAKVFLVVISFFNLLFNFLSFLMFADLGNYLFAGLGVFLVFFNLMFFIVTISAWRKK